MQILFINNNGAGFANYIDVPHGMTAGELFEREMRQAKATDYLIRVDSRPAARNQVLVEGNRVSITPTKIEGASATGRVLWAA
jgi:hypothetical protein